MSITLEKHGRRHYVVGNTYPIRSQLKEHGFNWDRDRKGWWTAKADRAEAVLSSLAGQAAAERKSNVSRHSAVAGRAMYKGRAYYIAARRAAAANGEVEPAVTRDGSKILLYFRDGTSEFWARRELVQVERWYEQVRTIADLQAFAERARRLEEDGETASGTCSECHRPIVDAPHHRAMGGLCGHCAFDEYDM